MGRPTLDNRAFNRSQLPILASKSHKLLEIGRVRRHGLLPALMRREIAVHELPVRLLESHSYA